MSDHHASLDEIWKLRNAAAITLGLAEDQMARAVRAASIDELVGLIEMFSPARSTGPEWVRSLEALTERMWIWRDPACIGALAEVFRARGMPWAAVANALAPEQGALTRTTTRHPPGARLPALTVV